MLSAAACAVALLTCVVAGQQRLDLPDQFRLGDARFGADPDQVELAALVEQALRGREVEDGDRRAADRVDRAEAHDAADAVPLDWAVSERADGLSDLEVLAGRRSPCRSRSGRRRGATARHELERVQALVGGGVDADGDALVRVSDRVAVLVDESRRVLDRALGEAHAGEALDLA